MHINHSLSYCFGALPVTSVPYYELITVHQLAIGRTRHILINVIRVAKIDNLNHYYIINLAPHYNSLLAIIIVSDQLERWLL